MKERPILFKGAMVRAILDGRKTQTRRIIKPKVAEIVDQVVNVNGKWVWDTLDYDFRALCPYGKSGDQLWVRETMRVIDIAAPNGVTAIRVKYLADGQNNDWILWPERLEGKPEIGKCLSYGGFREASRIDLGVENIRVERLQDITEEDAKAEGVDGPESESAKAVGWCVGPKAAYRFLWNSINGVDAWDANPYVWVVEFKRVKP